MLCCWVSKHRFSATRPRIKSSLRAVQVLSMGSRHLILNGAENLKATVSSERPGSPGIGFYAQLGRQPLIRAVSTLHLESVSLPESAAEFTNLAPPKAKSSCSFLTKERVRNATQKSEYHVPQELIL